MRLKKQFAHKGQQQKVLSCGKRAYPPCFLGVCNRRQTKQALLPRLGQSGRSMVEMLGVLAIIGVLTVGGVIGYRRAINSYEVGELLFSAKQYATQIFVGKGTRINEYGQPVLPTAKELGMNPLGIGMYPTDDYLKENGVELHLSFYNQNHCLFAADFLHTRCQLVSKGATCRQVEKPGIAPEDLARVVGCFDYVFHDN